MKKIYFGDFHTNIHSRQLDQLPSWVDFAKEMLDFWAPVYYPYFVNVNEQGFKFEDTLPMDVMQKDWKRINDYIDMDRSGFIMFPSYEWQGDGSDGDHNVFFLESHKEIANPSTYLDLYQQLRHEKVMAISHHPGYQSHHRGKNWDTHIEEFSPVTEIYSSHGSSEESDAAIPLNVHIHMGPRGEKGTVYHAIKKGVKTGIIASGDNHVCPAISGNGYFGVICEEYSKEAIFEAIKNRHTYGVNRNKIKLNYDIDGAIMGSEIQFKPSMKGRVEVDAGHTVDRIEVIRNGVIDHVYSHAGKWERKELDSKVRFKFELELGWGPDRRIFEDIKEKTWDVKLHTNGKIHSIEKLWTSPGSKVIVQDDQNFEAKVVTIKELPQQGKLHQKNYLTPQIQNQSFIFEIEDDVNQNLVFTIDGKEIKVLIKTLLNEAVLIAQEEEAHELIKERYGFETYYREDPWWHNAYKMLFHRAAPSQAYQLTYDFDVQYLETEVDSIFVKVIQKNGEVAWSSPIWIKQEERK